LESILLEVEGVISGVNQGPKRRASISGEEGPKGLQEMKKSGCRRARWRVKGPSCLTQTKKKSTFEGGKNRTEKVAMVMVAGVNQMQS